MAETRPGRDSKRARDKGNNAHPAWLGLPVAPAQPTFQVRVLSPISPAQAPFPAPAPAMTVQNHPLIPGHLSPPGALGTWKYLVAARLTTRPDPLLTSCQQARTSTDSRTRPKPAPLCCPSTLPPRYTSPVTPASLQRHSWSSSSPFASSPTSGPSTPRAD